MTPALTLFALPGIPLIQPGDDIASFIITSLRAASLVLEASDVLVITSKIVSKAERRRLDLRTVTPSARAQEIAVTTGKDPRLVEAVLSESSAVSRMGINVLITRHRLGFVSANAGIDHSNVGPDVEEWVLLLPQDPDASARRIRDALQRELGTAPGIIISDTHGRPHRLGNISVAIGVAGLPALLNLRGQPDLFGRALQYTEIGVADEIASAADLLSGQAAEGLPVMLVRGLHLPSGDGHASDLARPLNMDLYN